MSGLQDPLPVTGLPGVNGTQSMLIRFKQWLALWLSAAREASACLALGTRDALSPSIFVRSAALCISASLLWVWVYVRFFQEIMEFIGQFALVSFLGLFISGFQGLAPQFLGSGPTGGSFVNPLDAGLGLLRVGQILLIVAAAAVLLYVLVYLFAVATTVRLAAPRLLMPKAQRVVCRRYPTATESPSLRLAAAKRSRIRSVILVVVALCIPVLCACLILLGMCYLNVRLLYANAASKTASPELEASRLTKKWRPLLLLGTALIFLIAIPVFNLLVPGMMCTCVLHLLYRNSDEHASHVGMSGNEPFDSTQT